MIPSPFWRPSASVVLSTTPWCTATSPSSRAALPPSTKKRPPATRRLSVTNISTCNTCKPDGAAAPSGFCVRRRKLDRYEKEIVHVIHFARRLPLGKHGCLCAQNERLRAERPGNCSDPDHVEPDFCRGVSAAVPQGIPENPPEGPLVLHWNRACQPFPGSTLPA